VGIGNGAEYALLAYILPRYFGLRSYSEIYGSILGIVLLMMGTTPMLMDVGYDLHGSYGPSLTVITGALLVTSFLIMRLPTYRYAADGRALASPLQPRPAFTS